jgi:hypothetical protein
MFTFVKRIETTKDSIFYSFIHYKNEILGFGRKHYNNDENKIKMIKVDESFNIIEDNNQTINGEDPRCIIHKGNLYVTDNYFNKQKIYDYENKKYINIRITGKNLSLISHKDEMYFIHSTKPFVICKLNMNNEKIERLVTKQIFDVNSEYRGGTSGYCLKKFPNIYYGFGHRTYHKNDVLMHDIFLWIVDFTNEQPSIRVIDVEKPKNAKNICDPTCVIEINNKLYLVTAESDKAWFCEQDYITNVYEITDNNFLQMVM